MKRNSVVILAGDDPGYRVLFNAIKQSCDIPAILVESENNQKRILKGRIRRLGLIKTIGQILFKIIVEPILKLEARNRIADLNSIFDFSYEDIPDGIVARATSVNSFDLHGFIAKHGPDLVLLSGTRILSKRAIEDIAVPIWNIHVGITPKYRGVHGGYWALANNDEDNFGVTLHLVDEGIDSGKVIERSYLDHTERDNFVTYPLLQMGAGLRMLKRRVGQFGFDDDILASDLDLPSILWSHPTLCEYLVNRWKRGVK